MKNNSTYTEENIRSLDWKEHIRMRPGMYIGKLGDGSSPDDGIYILLKEVLDNCVDEFVMGAGKTIEIAIKDNTVKKLLSIFPIISFGFVSNLSTDIAFFVRIMSEPRVISNAKNEKINKFKIILKLPFFISLIFFAYREKSPKVRIKIEK